MRIFYARKTGRGLVNTTYGRGRSIHHFKMGGELLLAPGLGKTNMEGVSTGGGVSAMSDKLDDLEKQPIQNVMDKLSKLQYRSSGKKKNISFNL